MIPASFKYLVPRTLGEAVENIAHAMPQGTAILAGGMSLLPLMKLRIARPAVIVDIGQLDELAGISHAADGLIVGALVRHAELLVSDKLTNFPVFAETARVLGDPQVRNRGTIGGSLVQAHPAADWPAVFLALRGEVSLQGSRGVRTVRAEEFFTGVLTTAIEENEILVQIRFPTCGKQSGAAYSKMRQQASGMALVGVAVQVVLSEEGSIEDLAVGVTGINSSPFRACSIEKRLQGLRPESAMLAEICADVPEADPASDHHADAEYRRQVLKIHAVRAITTALQRARACRGQRP